MPAMIGGRFPGLAAATQPGRARRSALVIDDGRPCNRPSFAAHWVPGWDSAAPTEIPEGFCADRSVSPIIRLQDGPGGGLRGPIVDFTRIPEISAPMPTLRIVLALGVRDSLPDNPGLSAEWGRTGLNSPDCHGCETKGQSLIVLVPGTSASDQAHALHGDGSDEATMPINGEHRARIGSAPMVLDEPIPVAMLDNRHPDRPPMPRHSADRGGVFLTDMDRPSIFHGVFQIFAGPVALTHWTGGNHCARIVVIAHDIPRSGVLRSLGLLRTSQPNTYNHQSKQKETIL
ncbi:GTP-binding protein [Primorskyibacter sp. 2E107]|uniref:GTP-binding protein n=1 Tax=Primorskyibacter sp. 2E107 TaxID=3403458 RepID=UPI003AF49E24